MYQLINRAWYEARFRNKTRDHGRDRDRSILTTVSHVKDNDGCYIHIGKQIITRYDFTKKKRYDCPLDTRIFVQGWIGFAIWHVSIRRWIRSILRRWKAWASRQKYVRAANKIRKFYYDYVVPKIYNPHKEGKGFVMLREDLIKMNAVSVI